MLNFIGLRLFVPYPEALFPCLKNSTIPHTYNNLTAHQRELETDEAVQRAAQAMVPNPIYSGNPIYEEIVDSSMLKSLRNGVGVSETTSRDEGYVAISADAVKNVSWFPLPEESKLVEDKYATFPVSSQLFCTSKVTRSSRIMYK